MSNTAILILFVVLLLFVMFILPQLRLRKAIPSVIRLFRERNAVGVNNAKTIDELGLKPLTLTQAILRGRDYRLTALQVLRNANVIQSTEGGKLYLSEENLSTSRWN